MEREFGSLHAPMERPSITMEKLLQAMLLKQYVELVGRAEPVKPSSAGALFDVPD